MTNLPFWKRFRELDGGGCRNVCGKMGQGKRVHPLQTQSKLALYTKVEDLSAEI